jgi:hypothetical protein
LFHHHDVRWSHLKGWVLAWNDVAVAQITMVQAGSSCGTSIFFKESFPGWCFFFSATSVSVPMDGLENDENGTYVIVGVKPCDPHRWCDHGMIMVTLVHRSPHVSFFFRWTPQIIYPLVI